MLAHTTARFRWHLLLGVSVALHGVVLVIPLSLNSASESTTAALPLRVTLASNPAQDHTAPTPIHSRHARVLPPPMPHDRGRLAAEPRVSAPPPGFNENVATVNDAEIGSHAFVEARSTDVTHSEKITDSSPMAPDTRIVLAQIRELISRERYPELARRRGWEGEVQLGFRVEGSGAIDNIRVMHSSGNRLLDESAMRALRRVRAVPVELWLEGFSAELLLPVIYRLSES